MKYRFYILLKYSSFSINNHKYSFDVTFDSSRRHKMFSSLSNVCNEMKRSPFLLKFTISCVPLTHMRLLTLLILAACRICAKYERREQLASRRFSVALWLCGSVAVDAVSTLLSLFGFLARSLVQCFYCFNFRLFCILNIIWLSGGS